MSHAIEITDNLTTVAEETYKLHDKIERKGATEKSNLAIVKDLKTLSLQHISSIQDMAKQNNKLQNELIEDSSKIIENLLSEQDVNTDALNSKLMHMKDGIENFTSNALNIAHEEFTSFI